MTELLLDRLALEELDVVDDENIDSPQPFLESDRRLSLEGGNKAIHEALSREINDSPLVRRRRMDDGLKDVRFSQAHRGVEIERIVVQRFPHGREGDSLCRGMGELIGRSDEEICKSQSPV